MKNKLLTLTALAVGSTSAIADWTEIDTFDGADNTLDQWMVQTFDEAATGAVNSQLVVEADPTPANADDKCLVVDIGTSGIQAMALDFDDFDVALYNEGFDTEVRTVFYEWLIPNVVGADGTTVIGYQNATVGMISSAFYEAAGGVLPYSLENGGPKWGNYTGYIRSNSGLFDFRDDDFVPPNPDIQEVGDEWFKFWVVYDIPGQRYQVYCQGGSFDSPTLVTTEQVITDDSGTETTKFLDNWAAFRAEGSTYLDLFTMIVNINIDVTDGTKGNHNSYLDNLYVDNTGLNLTDPTCPTGDCTTLPPLEDSRLINISTRGSVGAAVSESLIGGFVIEGTEPMTVLVQAVGSELKDIPGTDLTDADLLANPVMIIQATDGSVSVTNDNWEDASNSADVAQAMIDAGANVLPTGSQSSSVLLTLQPGAYTAIVSGGGTEGIALVEAYEVSE